MTEARHQSKLGVINGPTALASGALISKAATLSVPNADVAITATEWAVSGFGVGTVEYELWRTDAGNIRRLAYGTIDVVS